MKGDYEEFHAFKATKKQTQSKPITKAGSGSEWIPAFAGMTNMESQHGGKF